MDIASVRRLAIIYIRLSDGRNERGTFEERKVVLRKYAESRGYEVIREVVENDEMPGKGDQKNASAFKRKKTKLPNGMIKLRVFRPGFRSILDDLSHGRADAIIAEDLDRVMRDPRDLEDLIDVCEYYGRSAFSVSGSLTLTNGGTDTEITSARMMVTMANKSSRDTARRVSDGRQRRAPSGTWAGGPRPYGFRDDGITVIEEEAREILRWAEAILAGVSLKSIANDLRAQGGTTPRGKQWTTQSVRSILLRPRNAGILVYRPVAKHERSEGNERHRYTREEEVGTTTLWDPIIPEDMWRTVVEKLLDPSRVTNPGSPAKWLGSGLYMCQCGEVMRVRSKRSGTRSYGCVSNDKGQVHASRLMEDVDKLVIDALVELLSRPDAADLFLKPSDPSVDLNAVRAEIAALREREDVFATEFAEGRISPNAMRAGMARIAGDIKEKEETLRRNTVVSPLTPLVGASDVRATWKSLPLGTKQQVIRALLTVTILPAGSNPYFDERLVRIEPLQVRADE